jgi:acyl-[acyl-carrier-protein] desaturase
VETSLLTEVNLPFFYHHLATTFKGSLKVLQDFVHTWVSEEDQHSSLLETYLIITRNADPHALHLLRKEVVEGGYAPDFDTAIETMVYTTVQELATLVFYNNVAIACKDHDKMLANLLRRIAKDESLHFAFIAMLLKVICCDHNFVYYIHKAMTNFAAWRQMPQFKDRGSHCQRCQLCPAFIQPSIRAFNLFGVRKPSRPDAEKAKRSMGYYQLRISRDLLQRQSLIKMLHKNI